MLASDAMVPIIAIVIVVFIALAIYGAMAAKKRRQALAAWAQANGLRFDPSNDAALDERYPQFKCLRQGDDRYGYDRIFGQWKGRELLGFDYHYETHSTDSKGHRTTHHHHFSAVIVGADVPLKPLLIRPEGLFDKVAEFFGADDVDFESAEFSRKFFVKADDRRWAYDVIHQRTMEFLLASPVFTIQFDTSSAIAFRDGCFSAEQFQQAAEVIAGLLERLPNYLVRQQTQGA